MKYAAEFVLLGALLLGAPVFAQTAQTADQHVSSGNDAFSLGNFDQAIVEYTKAIDMDPNSYKAYDNRGVAYAREGSLSRAIADFTMAIATNPKDADAYNNRGHAYAVNGNFSQAIFDYTRAIEHNAFYVKAYNNRAIIYYKLKEYAKAWADVHTVQAVGGNIDPPFLDDLKKASGVNQ